MLRAALARTRTVEVMDRAEALLLLPEAYARALTLREGGASPADIAGDLDIVVEAVPSLLRLAEAKLARLLAEVPGQNGSARPDGQNRPDGPPPRSRGSAAHESAT
jgi:DNA-directed RNA polymerase specialized sigma24 family protein